MYGKRNKPKVKLVSSFLFMVVFVSCQLLLKSSGEQLSIETAPLVEELISQQHTAVTEIPTLSPIPTSDSSRNPTFTTQISQQADKIPTSTKTLIFATITPLATPTHTSFAVIGDYGLAGIPEEDVADLVKSWDPDFIITVGDNNYPDGATETIDENIGQYYRGFIYPYVGSYGEGSEINRFFPTLGNHDWNINQASAYLDYFTLPGNERYYDFVWGPVHLFAIDSDSREPDGVGRTTTQGQWLREKLEASKAVWKIVYMHHPPYTSSVEEGSIDWMQWPFKEWGATAVITGHGHVYERVIVDGFPYFVNGLGGGPRYDFIEPISGSQVRYRDDYGAMLIEATMDQITFQFVTRLHELIDTFEIIKTNRN